MRRSLCLLALWTVPCLVSGLHAGDGPKRIEKVMAAPEYKHAHWGVLFADLEKGEVVYEHSADKLFVPASTTKLFTVATALDALGAGYRFETPVVRRGDVKADVLEGDLILIASGDLTMGGRTDAQGRIAFTNSDHTYSSTTGKSELTEPDPLAGLKELARQVAAAGIKRVTGDVLIDDRLFEQSQSSGSGPTRVTPIVVNDNVIDILITPAMAGSAAKVTWRPQTTSVRVDERVETVAAGGTSQVTVSALGYNRILVRGHVPEGRKPLVMISEVHNPSSFARSLFIEALRGHGVLVNASPLEWNHVDDLPALAECQKLPRVALLTSPPFAENARLILKVSHNLHASTLPLLVAAKHGKRTLDEGLRLQHDFLARAGVEVETISFGGGAGGSRSDYSTPRATVQLLRAMHGRPDHEAYLKALPLLGVDGTLSTHASADSPARGKVQAKTGTLFWTNSMNGRELMTSKALAGYMSTSGGRRLAFALFVNNVHINTSEEANQAGKTLGRLCEIAYEAW